MWFFLIKSTHLFYIKKCGYKRGTSFANGFKFPKMNSTEVVVLTRTTNFTKVMVLTLMKSWGEKIQLNITKSIKIFNRTFHYKNLCSFLGIKLWEKKKLIKKGIKFLRRQLVLNIKIKIIFTNFKGRHLIY